MNEVPAPPPEPPRRRPSLIPLGIMALILIAGLTMLWRGSFRRPLDDQEIEKKLSAAATDYETGHAAEEMTRRMQRNDPSAKRFYPAVLALAQSPSAEKRRLMAWVMGHDPKEASFRDALTKLIDDPVTIVAYNAAPALAVHGSPAGRKVLLAMLKPSNIVGHVEGTFHPKAKAGETLDPRSTLGTITAKAGEAVVEPMLAGRVETILPDGTAVSDGTVLATLNPAQAHALYALVALTIPGIGQPEDADAVEAFLKVNPDLEQNVKDQAHEAMLALRKPQ